MIVRCCGVVGGVGLVCVDRNTDSVASVSSGMTCAWMVRGVHFCGYCLLFD